MRAKAPEESIHGIILLLPSRYRLAAWELVSTMKALILAGGFGTRLRPLSCTRPKSLFPIVNKPLLQWIFERLDANGIHEAILAVNYQTEAAMKQHRVPKYGVRTKYSRDPLRKPLGTGGPIKKAQKHLGHDAPFLVLNGDIFADIKYTEILKDHEKKKAVATIALHQVEDPSRYGVVELAENGQIKEFVEKPLQESAPSNLINAGAYVLSPNIFKYIPKDRAVSIEHEVFPRLAKEGKLYGHIYEGLWKDIGKPEDYLEINRVLINSVATQQGRSGKKAEIRYPTVLDKKVSIGEKSIIGPYAILGRNVTIENNVHIQNSVILPDAMISDHSSINGAILGEGVIVRKGVTIMNGCILGDHAKIGENVTLAEGVTVCPAEEIHESMQTPRSKG